MDFIFRIQNHYFEKGTPWVELDKIKQRSWFLSVDIEDDEVLPCYDTEHELRISQGIAFKSVKILTGKTQETHPYWEALLDMSYLNSTELRDVRLRIFLAKAEFICSIFGSIMMVKNLILETTSKNYANSAINGMMSGYVQNVVFVRQTGLKLI